MHTLVGIAAGANSMAMAFGGDEQGAIVGTFAVKNSHGANVDLSVSATPSPVRNAGGTYVPSDKGGAVVMFGGEVPMTDESFVVTNDLVIMKPVPGAASSNGMLKRADFVVEINPETRGVTPCARTGALVSRLGNQLVVACGKDANGDALFDCYTLDLATMSWSKVFKLSKTLLPENPMPLVMGDKFVMLGCNMGSSKLSLAMALHVPAALASLQFKTMMLESLPERLALVDAWVERQGTGLDMCLNLETLEQSREKQIKVAEALFEIANKADKVDLELDTLNASFFHMKRIRAPLAKEEKELEELIERWAEVRKDAQGPVGKEFQPFHEKLSNELRTNYKEFEREQLREYRNAFEKNSFFQAGSLETSYDDMSKAYAELLTYKQKCYDMSASALTFGLMSLTDNGVKMIGEMVAYMKQIKGVWDVTRMVQSQVSAWRTVAWSDVVVEDLEDGGKNLEKEVKALDKNIKDMACFKALQQDVRNFMVSVPLVADLRSPAMRERHWKLLMETTKTSFVIDANFKLADLLALELHKFEDDVGEIVDRAQKEEKMEQNLKKLDDVWSNADLDFQQFKGTDVFLTKMKEEDFEALEENQVLVQGMMANRYMATFRDEILGWNKKLMNVYDVNTLMTEIQRSWSNLESLFIHSEEVKKELPDTATRFAAIDRDIKAILKVMHSTVNVVKCCNKEGLMADLERLQSELEICPSVAPSRGSTSCRVTTCSTFWRRVTSRPRS
jgi:dynein heavy chain, axonemal